MGSGPDSALCYNCSAPLSGPFCAACGQKAKALNPTLAANTIVVKAALADPGNGWSHET